MKERVQRSGFRVQEKKDNQGEVFYYKSIKHYKILGDFAFVPRSVIKYFRIFAKNPF